MSESRTETEFPLPFQSMESIEASLNVNLGNSQSYYNNNPRVASTNEHRFTSTCVCAVFSVTAYDKCNILSDADSFILSFSLITTFPRKDFRPRVKNYEQLYLRTCQGNAIKISESKAEKAICFSKLRLVCKVTIIRPIVT